METDRPPYDPLDDQDEEYFGDAERSERPRAFDATLLQAPVSVIPDQRPLVFSRDDSVTDAVRGMQKEHRGAVLICEDGTPASRVIGIFTERDVLFRIMDGGRNPARLPLEQVMTPDPECLTDDQTIADVLRMMSVGGFRHVPVIDERGCPVGVVSVKDVVELLVEAFPAEILNKGGDRQSEREGG